jgi:hypothetical protein
MASADLSRRVEKVVGYSRSPTASRALSAHSRAGALFTWLPGSAVPLRAA